MSCVTIPTVRKFLKMPSLLIYLIIQTESSEQLQVYVYQLKSQLKPLHLQRKIGFKNHWYYSLQQKLGSRNFPENSYRNWFISIIEMVILSNTSLDFFHEGHNQQHYTQRKGFDLNFSRLVFSASNSGHSQKPKVYWLLSIFNFIILHNYRVIFSVKVSIKGLKNVQWVSYR